MRDDLRDRLESYFVHNPGDGLTVKDAAVKFTTEIHRAKKELNRLRMLGVVRVAKGPRGLMSGRPAYVYEAA